MRGELTGPVCTAFEPPRFAVTKTSAPARRTALSLTSWPRKRHSNSWNASHGYDCGAQHGELSARACTRPQRLPHAFARVARVCSTQTVQAAHVQRSEQRDVAAHSTAATMCSSTDEAWPTLPFHNSVAETVRIRVRALRTSRPKNPQQRLRITLTRTPLLLEPARTPSQEQCQAVMLRAARFVAYTAVCRACGACTATRHFTIAASASLRALR